MALKDDDSRYHMYSRRAAMLAGGKLLLVSGLVGRLYYLQVLQRDQYEVLAEENRISLRILAPERGKILDRYGRELATNRRDFRVTLIPEQSQDVEGTLAALSGIVSLTPRDLRRIRRAIRRQRAFIPVTIADNLSWSAFAKVNLSLPDLPGVQPEVGVTRDYPYKHLGAHILGYVGAPNQDEVGDDPVLELPGFRVGKNGMERVLDRRLRGLAGNSKVEVNAVGRVIREVSRVDSISGEDMHLTLDLDLQQFAAQRLSTESASAVVMDVQNGDVLALASTPSYDPNDFNTGISQKKWDQLIGDIRKPLINKAVSGQYPPGSTFKMIVALAALEAGVVTPTEQIFCNGEYELGDHTFHCWKKHGHGNMDLDQAIAQSCDVYFFEIARRVGIDKISDMARRFGLGEKYDLEIPAEARGLIPGRGWKLATEGKRWQQGDTVNVGIGQGYVLTTPLQLAVMTARIANGGVKVEPVLRRRSQHEVQEGDSPTTVGGWAEQLGAFPEKPQDSTGDDVGVSPRYMRQIMSAMTSVTSDTEGTAYASRLDVAGMGMAGKTGTAQVRRITKQERESGVLKNEDIPWLSRDHALFVGYAPVDKPRYAIAVVVEHGGSGSSAAAPVARDILRHALENDKRRDAQREADEGQKT
ncbi:MAG: penicillin-binding protein 2 [Kordiimonas sp.]|nr:penicillin-binding protein 2 [Kordiimonas sp.]|tara:strand:- start:72 stop:2000 length:1929 start_codon:yes stop_codon:yes gene_type:complete